MMNWNVQNQPFCFSVLWYLGLISLEMLKISFKNSSFAIRYYVFKCKYLDFSGLLFCFHLCWKSKAWSQIWWPGQNWACWKIIWWKIHETLWHRNSPTAIPSGPSRNDHVGICPFQFQYCHFLIFPMWRSGFCTFLKVKYIKKSKYTEFK